MYIRRLETLADVSSTQWNALVRNQNPFLRYEFLIALERHHCVGNRTGWLPHHFVCFDENHCLIGATPMYLKDNSYGEFVFDWSWADAHRRCHLPYYPKLVSAIPFTPATGQRLLLAANLSETSQREAAKMLISHALEETRRQGYSSLHWLFTTDADMQALLSQGLLRRYDCQFHWHNQNYRDFADFLDTLTSKRRKAIKRERRRVAEENVALQILQGSEVSDSQWYYLHTFYRSTFQRLGGIPTLTLPFFQEIATTMGEQIILALALVNAEPVAGAISFRSAETLYGRHWGCTTAYDSLHFEACYYQGIDYCIRHGLRRFEPGAQGEHKVYRGFLPTLTQSAHWLAHPGLRKAVADFLLRETRAIQHYAETLLQHSPYRQEML
jgi:hypothetical protein